MATATNHVQGSESLACNQSLTGAAPPGKSAVFSITRPTGLFRLPCGFFSLWDIAFSCRKAFGEVHPEEGRKEVFLALQQPVI
jgi:hypothetical protein